MIYTGTGAGIKFRQGPRLIAEMSGFNIAPKERPTYESGACVRTISAIECGIANPTADVIESLARALGVSAAWLVG